LAVFLAFKTVSGCSRPKSDWQIVGPAVVKKGDLTVKVTTTGEVKPYNRVEIKPPIPGRVEEVLVAEGDAVHKGQILAWMSSTDRATLLDAATVKGEKEFQYWQDAYKAAPLISPLDGTLIVRSVEPGQTVTSADPVVVIADRLIVEALVDETDLSLIKNGQAAEIRLDAYPDKPIPAKVDHLSYESQLINSVNVYKVDVLPGEIPESFRSGMTANVTFIVSELKDVLLIPSEAVSEWPKGAVKPPAGGRFAVYVKEFGGKLKPVAVKTGESDSKMTEVKEGLTEGAVIQIVRKKQSTSVTPFSAFGSQKKDSKGKT